MTRMTNPDRLNRALDGDYTTPNSRAWADALNSPERRLGHFLADEHAAARELRRRIIGRRQFWANVIAWPVALVISGTLAYLAFRAVGAIMAEAFG